MKFTADGEVGWPFAPDFEVFLGPRREPGDTEDEAAAGEEAHRAAGGAGGRAGGPGRSSPGPSGALAAHGGRTLVLSAARGAGQMASAVERELRRELGQFHRELSG